MPFWLGMLTEDQHPYDDLVRAIQQASFDLYFRETAVCERPGYVIDHGISLENVLNGQRIQILGSDRTPTSPTMRSSIVSEVPGDSKSRVLVIRKVTNASWSNILKAIDALEGRTDIVFGTPNVTSSSKSIARRILRETGLSLTQLRAIVEEVAR